MKTMNLFVVGLMSSSLIAMELVWTRLFSAEFFYTFAFLTLSLAVMGLGLGALVLHLWSGLDKKPSLGVLLSLAGMAILIGPMLVFRLNPDFSRLFSSIAVIVTFILTILLLSSSFFFGGMALALLFKKNHKEMPRLYMADLLGAGVGVVMAILLMNAFSTPVTAFLIALPILIASFMSSHGIWKRLPALLIVATLILSAFVSSSLQIEREEEAPVIYTHWDAMAQIKVHDYGRFRVINTDNASKSPVLPFDGNYRAFAYFDPQWELDVSYLIKRFPSCTFLSLGAGGGSDVLQALAEGANEVHAVEVIPHINRMMLRGDPAGYKKVAGRNALGRIVTLVDYSGRIYHSPRVNVVTEDARAYIRRFRNTFDLIYSLSSNTWAALASGSFALAENYLFTTEAIKDYWEALTQNGFLVMEHQVYMPRIVSEVLDALNELKVASPTEHVAVYDLPSKNRKVLLLSKKPLTDDIRYNALGKIVPEDNETIRLLYPAPDSHGDNLIHRIVINGYRQVAPYASIDISPCTDDRPFIAQLGLWKHFRFDRLKNLDPYAELFQGFPISKMLLSVILLVVVLIIIPLNLLPYLRSEEKLRGVPWMYFFAIGMAFMMVEVVLIQKYALFIGSPSYSIVTILLTLLIGSGIGSRFSRKVSDRTAFIGILSWLVLDILILRHVTHALGGLGIAPRVLVSIVLIAPLGFFMGMPFPKAALRIGALIDWGFAVNGAASVLGATLILLVAISMGFTASLVLAGLLYSAAYVLLKRKSAWRRI